MSSIAMIYNNKTMCLFTSPDEQCEHVECTLIKTIQKQNPHLFSNSDVKSATSIKCRQQINEGQYAFDEKYIQINPFSNLSSDQQSDDQIKKSEGSLLRIKSRQQKVETADRWQKKDHALTSSQGLKKNQIDEEPPQEKPGQNRTSVKAPRNEQTSMKCEQNSKNPYNKPRNFVPSQQSSCRCEGSCCNGLQQRVDYLEREVFQLKSIINTLFSAGNSTAMFSPYGFHHPHQQ